MKKKIFGFVLGAIFTVMSGAAVFSVFDVQAGPVEGIYKLDVNTNIWCDEMGNNCLPDLIVK